MWSLYQGGWTVFCKTKTRKPKSEKYKIVIISGSLPDQRWSLTKVYLYTVFNFCPKRQEGWSEWSKDEKNEQKVGE